jgi:hypothetical protein
MKERSVDPLCSRATGFVHMQAVDLDGSGEDPLCWRSQWIEHHSFNIDILRKVQMLRFLNHILRRRQSLPNCTSGSTTILHQGLLSSSTNLLFLKSTAAKVPLDLTLCNSARLHGYMGTFSSSQIAGPITKLPYRRRGTTTRITKYLRFCHPHPGHCIRAARVFLVGIIQGPSMSGFVARVRAFSYKSTLFYANSVCAVAQATNPLMEGPCTPSWES